MNKTTSHSPTWPRSAGTLGTPSTTPQGHDPATALDSHLHALEHRGVRSLDLSGQVLPDPQAFLEQLRTLKGAALESLDLSGTRFVGSDPAAGESPQPLTPAHLATIADIVAACPTLRELRLNGQIGLSAQPDDHDGAPPMHKLMAAVGESNVVWLELRNCGLGLGDWPAIESALDQRDPGHRIRSANKAIECSGKWYSPGSERVAEARGFLAAPHRDPSSGLQMLDLSGNEDLYPSRDNNRTAYMARLSFIQNLNHNTSLRELHLPWSATELLIDSAQELRLPDNHTLCVLTPFSNALRQRVGLKDLIDVLDRNQQHAAVQWRAVTVAWIAETCHGAPRDIARQLASHVQNHAVHAPPDNPSPH
ncbi:hypothetical protein [Hydrogenophaga sp. T2]|uniref:hypothetical protein n=1 Tax=Hydrogenophaga sp. T2 TaxID=3132823 RepID=UPI003CEC5BD0